MEANTENPVRHAAEIVGGITSLAQKIDVTAPTVHQWITGERRVPAERCIDIEDATSGLVTAERLRPDIKWHVIRNTKAA